MIKKILVLNIFEEINSGCLIWGIKLWVCIIGFVISCGKKDI